MQKISKEELITPENFSKILQEERREIIGLKKFRRIESRTFSYLFENRETIRNQMNEMILIENMHDPSEIEHILNTYNELIPSENQLSVSMFIEISDEKVLLKEMPRLSGVEQEVYLIFGENELKAVPEEGRSTETLESTLQYLKFNFDDRMKGIFKSAKTAFIVTRQKNYKESAEITSELLRTLQNEIN